MDNYKILLKLKESTLKSIFVAKKKDSDREIIIKKIPIDHKFGLSVSAIREIKALKKLKSSCFICLYDVFIEKNILYLILQHMPFSLDTLISENYIFSRDVFDSIVYQLFDAVAFIHKQGMIHRNLKPSNILLDYNCFFKLTNFESSRCTNTAMTNEVTSLHYRAPELLLGDVDYSNKIDSWSIACILVEIKTGSPPFKSIDEISQCKVILKSLGIPDCDYPWNKIYNIQQYATRESLDQILQAKFGNLFEEKLFLVVKELFQINKHKRLSVTNALKLPIIKAGYNIKCTINPSSLNKM